MRQPYQNNFEIKHSNSNYDRKSAQKYAIEYALNPSIKGYPYFKENDCANFISQVLKAGGMREKGIHWNEVGSWFCRTKNIKDLDNISITWRAARYFRRYWGNEDGVGANKASIYIESTAKKVLYNFRSIYEFLNIGDVIQYGNPLDKFPYHTQVIVHKGYNSEVGIYDLFMAQHTENRINISFYNYLITLENKEIRPVYIYKMRVD